MPANQLLDNFFDEIFGQSDKDKQAGVAAPAAAGPAAVALTAPVAAAACSSAYNFARFEADVEDVVCARAPALPRLTSLLLQGGYVPPALRGRVWCLLLTGSCSGAGDDTGVSSTQLEAHLPPATLAALQADCDALAREADAAGAGRASLRGDLFDVVGLFCLRRECRYSPLLCRLVAPMLLGAAPFTRGAASTCLYALASEFAPLLYLQLGLAPRHVAVDAGSGGGPAAEEPSSSSSLSAAAAVPGGERPPALLAAAAAWAAVRAWLRLLVFYHSPALAQHLDRVWPGWEGETAEDGGGGGGGVPLRWLCAFFSGSVPADAALTLLDWAALNEQRYAGAFLAHTNPTNNPHPTLTLT